MVDVYADLQTLNHCCGVVEIGDIHEGTSRYSEVKASSSTLSGAFSNLLNAIRTRGSDDEDVEYNTQGRVIQVWFHRLRRHDGTWESQYINHELRELVRAIPNVVHLGTIVNDNSGNIIDGYCWANKAEVINES